MSDVPKLLYAVAYRAHLAPGFMNLRRKRSVDPHHRVFARAVAEAEHLEKEGWPTGSAVIMVWSNGQWRPLADARWECPT